MGGDLGVSVKHYLEEYQKQTKNTINVQSIEEIKRFVDEYPEFKRLSGSVSKHVAVVHELSRIVEENGLLLVSQLEQSLACEENRQEHFKQVSELLRSSDITNMERLRLVLIYCLRYEQDRSSISQLKHLLLSQGIAPEQVALADKLIQHAGSRVRSGDLFQNKSLFAKAQSALQGFKGVDNVYTQHKTYLATLIDQLMKGRMKDTSYPYTEGSPGTFVRDHGPVSKLVVFVVGGTTFEEARDVAEYNKSLDGGRWIVLGGTTIHNSRSFLADVAQLELVSGPE